MGDIPKVERDGKVAVIVSPGYGAGWSTWATNLGEASIYAPDVVAWIEDGKPDDAVRVEGFERYGYTGGLYQAEVEWVPKGARFIIDEYDGHESLTVLGPDFGHVA